MKVYDSYRVYELRYYLNGELVKLQRVRDNNRRDAEYYHRDWEFKCDRFEIVSL